MGAVTCSTLLPTPPQTTRLHPTSTHQPPPPPPIPSPSPPNYRTGLPLVDPKDVCPTLTKLGSDAADRSVLSFSFRSLVSISLRILCKGKNMSWHTYSTQQISIYYTGAHWPHFIRLQLQSWSKLFIWPFKTNPSPIQCSVFWHSLAWGSLKNQHLGRESGTSWPLNELHLRATRILAAHNGALQLFDHAPVPRSPISLIPD